MIETARLILRPWRAEDGAAYAAMLADEEVAGWIGGPFDAGQAAERMARSNAAIETHGYGRFAVERRADGRLLGHCGLMPIAETLPVGPGAEIGWALIGEAWGEGYASEAARAVIADAFQRLRLPEVIAFTTLANLRSQAVMQRLGMVHTPERDFDHPLFPAGHPLRRHVVFVARAS